MKRYNVTVIGYYPDTNQRFAEVIEQAFNHADAEQRAILEHPGLAVVASYYIAADGLPKFDNTAKVRTA